MKKIIMIMLGILITNKVWAEINCKNIQRLDNDNIITLVDLSWGIAIGYGIGLQTGSTPSNIIDFNKWEKDTILYHQNVITNTSPSDLVQFLSEYCNTYPNDTILDGLSTILDNIHHSHYPIHTKYRYR